MEMEEEGFEEIEGSPLQEDELVEPSELEEEITNLRKIFEDNPNRLNQTVDELVNSSHTRLNLLGKQVRKAYRILDKKEPSEPKEIEDYKQIFEQAHEEVENRFKRYKNKLTSSKGLETHLKELAEVGNPEEVENHLEALNESKWFKRFDENNQKKLLITLKEKFDEDKEIREIVEGSKISVPHLMGEETEIDEESVWKGVLRNLEKV